MSLNGSQLADLEEIRGLSCRYALELDRFDLDGLLAPFADDIVFDATPVGLETYVGIDVLREFFEHNQDVMADQMHMITNFVIEFDGPDDASGSNYLFQDGHMKDGSRITTWARNEDRYRRTANGWRIAHRRITPLMPPQLGGYVQS